MIRSSAYRKLLKQPLLIKHPAEVFSRSISTISINAEKSRGERTLPCLTPDSISTGPDSELFHFTCAEEMRNQCSMTSIKEGFINLFWSIDRMPQTLALSNAFLTSMQAML